MSLRRLLGPDPLARLEHQTSIDRILARLGHLLPTNIGEQRVLALRPYVETEPLCYWNDEIVTKTIARIEQDEARALDSFEYHHESLHRGIENLHRKRTSTELQNSYDHGRARDLLIIANTFLPSYLWVAEHVLGNLTPVLWSICKKGDIEGKFILKNALALLETTGLQTLTSGYNDRVRNAIAHGQVRFAGLEIEFGFNHITKLSSADFLRLFDNLVANCTSLGLALQLFWLKQQDRAQRPRTPPLALILQSAAGAVSRDGLSLEGGIVSSSPLAGRQLHIALIVDNNSRNQMLLESCRVARELLDQGAVGFDRFLFELDSGRDVSSLVTVLPSALASLLEADASADCLSQILADTPLLWHDEPHWRTSLRALRKIARSARRQAGQNLLAEWHRHGLLLASGRYRVREIRNLSVSGIARIEIRAQLLHPQYAENRTVVNAIIQRLIRFGRRRLVQSRPSSMDKGIPWLKRPRHVVVQLFRHDGPSRWLQRDGWFGGNIVAVAERAWSRAPVMVRNPQVQIGKIGIRYEIDRDEAARAFARMNEVIAEIRSQRGMA